MRVLFFTNVGSFGSHLFQRELGNVLVLTAEEQLLNELRREACHLVLLHLGAPDNTELLHRVTAIRPDAPVILLTADAEEHWSEVIRSGRLERLELAPHRLLRSGDAEMAAHLHVDLRRAVQYMHDNMFDPDLSLDQVAAQIPVSRFHFSRVFSKQMGISFRNYLIQLRVEAAKRMLAGGQRTVTDVCFAVGYNDLTHFGRIFRKYTGNTPSVFRARSMAAHAHPQRLGVAAGQ